MLVNVKLEIRGYVRRICISRLHASLRQTPFLMALVKAKLAMLVFLYCIDLWKTLLHWHE